jgi:transposase InsO family protein
MLGKRRTLPPWQRIELVELVEAGWTRRQAAAWRRVSPATVQSWVTRKRAASAAELDDGSWALDRSSRPHLSPGLTSDRDHDRVCATRERTGWGPRLIAGELAMAHATVSRCLARRGLSRVAREPRQAAVRYEWPCPGDLLHMDVKRFQRFDSPGHAKTGERHRTGAEKRARVGYVFAHTLLDDHSRYAYTELHPDERAATVTGFVERGLAHFATLGVIAQRLLTDNAFTYVHNRALRELLAEHDVRHLRTRPRRPQTNGKVERFHQTLKREWGLGLSYRSSEHRDRALPHWLEHYNTRRPHSGIGARPPITRVQNLPRQDS